MKFVDRRPFTDPDAAARELVEIANDVEAVQDGRIFIERVNAPFLAAGGSGEAFRAGIERAVALGWRWLHESGTYVKFTMPGRHCLLEGKFTCTACGKPRCGCATHHQLAMARRGAGSALN
jgi:hypothetical protein